jgi:hypothetical protein
VSLLLSIPEGALISQLLVLAAWIGDHLTIRIRNMRKCVIALTNIPIVPDGYMQHAQSIFTSCLCAFNIIRHLAPCLQPPHPTS